MFKENIIKRGEYLADTILFEFITVLFVFEFQLNKTM